jgi:hypothetical protein
MLLASGHQRGLSRQPSRNSMDNGSDAQRCWCLFCHQTAEYGYFVMVCHAHPAAKAGR